MRIKKKKSGTGVRNQVVALRNGMCLNQNVNCLLPSLFQLSETLFLKKIYVCIHLKHFLKNIRLHSFKSQLYREGKIEGKREGERMSERERERERISRKLDPKWS